VLDTTPNTIPDTTEVQEVQIDRSLHTSDSKGTTTMTINEQPLTPARWRRLAPELRAELRQVLGTKARILNRPVLDVAKDLCARDAYLLALGVYAALQGEPPPEAEPCGLGVILRCQDLMGEAPAEIGATLLV
jgi:hypothetical protein